MYVIVCIFFILGYIAIACEEFIKINKAAIALFMGVICWVMITPGMVEPAEQVASHHLSPILSEIASVIFFLLSAMTIVELIDIHGGFKTITSRIHSTSRVGLLWIISLTSFFLSAILDNMTTTIVMLLLLRKIVNSQEDRWLMSGFVVIAANAGGAFSPIGDVTSIILWVNKKVTASQLILQLFIPSLMVIIAPLVAISFKLKGDIDKPEHSDEDAPLHDEPEVKRSEKLTILFMGVLSLLCIPVFKEITHFEPYMGAFLSLSILWIVTELMHLKKEEEDRQILSINSVLKKIDTTSLLYLTGILLAVGALHTSGHLADLATVLKNTFGDSLYPIPVLTGLLSAIVDNSALVTAAKDMYTFEVDHKFWHLVALTAGTGGSCLIIGSAAGIAAMGLTKMSFGWYAKNISVWAILGYVAGIATFWLLSFLH